MACGTLPENQAQTLKLCFSYGPPSRGHTSVGQPTRTYLLQLCTDTGCSLEDLPGVMDYRDGWMERESGKSMLVA